MATSNFWTQDNFDLWAGNIHDEEDWEQEDNYDQAADLAEELNKELRFYQLEIKGGYYQGIQVFINEDELPDDSWVDNYPEYVFQEYGVNRYVLRRMIAAERKRINEKLLPKFRDFGFCKLGISARFSNGETWYTKIA